MDILQNIIDHKKLEVEKRMRQTSLTELQSMNGFRREIFSLRNNLLKRDSSGIIAEFKRRSPSKGVINPVATVSEVTSAYAQNGAAGISVLTDQDFFGGSLDDLEIARGNSVPLLRKEFIIEPYQITESKAFGADLILLIAAVLTPTQVKDFAKRAHDLSLEVLLEIHNEEELEHICGEVDMVGVNNRNLKTFEVDINTSLSLIKQIPQSKPAVSESGITLPATIQALRKVGFKGFLIGENFMKEKDPALAFADFVKQLDASNQG